MLFLKTKSFLYQQISEKRPSKAVLMRQMLQCMKTQGSKDAALKKPTCLPPYSTLYNKHLKSIRIQALIFCLFVFHFHWASTNRNAENTLSDRFYWNIIALQCHVSFCCTAARISHMYTHMPLVLHLPLTLSFHPSMSSPSTELSSLCYTAASPQLATVQ